MAETKQDTPRKRRMGFVHKPDGVPEEKWGRWPFEPGRMDNLEAELIEDVTGWTFVEWQERFFSGSMKAVHALLWIYLRREHSGLKYADVRFTDAETWFGVVDEHGNPVSAEDNQDDEDDGGAEGKAPEAAPETTPDP